MSLKAIDKIQEKAERLYTLCRLIEDMDERQQEEMGTLKQQREILQDELLTEFKRVGIDQIKVNGGNTVARATRKGVEVTSEAHALQWAIDNRAVSVNKNLVKQKLEDVLKEGKPLPAGFEYKESEYISVRKPKGATPEVEAKKE